MKYLVKFLVKYLVRSLVALVLLSLLALVLLAMPATSQTSCAPRDTVVERLQSFYSEAYQGGGMQNATSIIEIWSSDETGSWTVLITRADGISCIVATGQNGQNWRDAPDQRQGPDAVANPRIRV